MSEHTARVSWRRGQDEPYLDNKYNRGHEWSFDGGLTVPASSSPHVVPVPFSVEANVDPEEAFIAALSSCHMLFFLAIAAKRKLVVDEYVDDAVGMIERRDDGRSWMSKVTLNPKISFSGDNQPTMEQLERIHHQSHEQCFIANSVRTEVKVETRA